MKKRQQNFDDDFEYKYPVDKHSQPSAANLTPAETAALVHTVVETTEKLRRLTGAHGAAPQKSVAVSNTPAPAVRDYVTRRMPTFVNTRKFGCSDADMLAFFKRNGQQDRFVVHALPARLADKPVADLVPEDYKFFPQHHPVWYALRKKRRAMFLSELGNYLFMMEPYFESYVTNSTATADRIVKKRIEDYGSGAAAYSAEWEDFANRWHYSYNLPSRQKDGTSSLFMPWGTHHEPPNTGLFILKNPQFNIELSGLNGLRRDYFREMKYRNYLYEGARTVVRRVHDPFEDDDDETDDETDDEDKDTERNKGEFDYKVFESLSFELAGSPDAILIDKVTGVRYDLEAKGVAGAFPTNPTNEQMRANLLNCFAGVEGFIRDQSTVKPYDKFKHYYFAQLHGQMCVFEVEEAFASSWTYNGGCRVFRFGVDHEYMSLIFTLLEYVIRTFITRPSVDKKTGVTRPYTRVPYNYFSPDNGHPNPLMAAPARVKAVFRRFMELTKKMYNMEDYNGNEPTIHADIAPEETKRVAELFRDSKQDPYSVYMPEIPHELCEFHHAQIYLRALCAEQPARALKYVDNVMMLDGRAANIETLLKHVGVLGETCRDVVTHIAHGAYFADQVLAPELDMTLADSKKHYVQQELVRLERLRLQERYLSYAARILFRARYPEYPIFVKDSYEVRGFDYIDEPFPYLRWQGADKTRLGSTLLRTFNMLRRAFVANAPLDDATITELENAPLDAEMDDETLADVRTVCLHFVREMCRDDKSSLGDAYDCMCLAGDERDFKIRSRFEYFGVNNFHVLFKERPCSSDVARLFTACLWLQTCVVLKSRHVPPLNTPDLDKYEYRHRFCREPVDDEDADDED